MNEKHFFLLFITLIAFYFVVLLFQIYLINKITEGKVYVVNENKQSTLMYYIELLKIMISYYKNYFLLQKRYDKNELKHKIYNKIIDNVNLKEIQDNLKLNENGTKEFIAMIVNEYVENTKK